MEKEPVNPLAACVRRSFYSFGDDGPSSFGDVPKAVKPCFEAWKSLAAPNDVISSVLGVHSTSNAGNALQPTSTSLHPTSIGVHEGWTSKMKGERHPGPQMDPNMGERPTARPTLKHPAIAREVGRVWLHATSRSATWCGAQLAIYIKMGSR